MRHLPELSLSLQFAKLPDAARHRAALPRHRVVRYLRHALPFDAEMTVRIVDEAEGRALNLSYRKKDYATNVLTFDYTRPPQSPLLLADLVLCAPVVAREAKEQGKTLAAHYAHLLVHGALHAAGYDHETNERDALEMEALEIWLLDVLGFKNPY
jgi:probable rRNA maturation factor